MIDGNGYSDIQSVNQCVEYINKYLEHIESKQQQRFQRERYIMRIFTMCYKKITINSEVQ